MLIDKTTIVGLQMEMIKRFGTQTLRRGWNAHQAGQADELQVRDERLYGKVRNNKGQIQEVILDLVSFERSSCTCRTKRYCYHMAAVFFAVYAEHEKRTELFLMQHGQMRLLRSKEREQRKKKADQEKKDLTAAWDRAQAVKETDSITAWHLDLEKKFSGFFASPSQQIEVFHSEVQKYVLRCSSTWNSPVRELYQALAELYILVLAENRYKALHDGYRPAAIDEGFNRLFEICTKGFQRRLKFLALTTLDSRLLDHLQQTTAWLHRYAFRGERTPVRWLDVYRLWCWKLGEGSARLMTELRERLAAEPADDTQPAIRRYKLKLAFLHLEIMSGRSGAFADLLSFVQDYSDIEHLFLYVDHSMQTRQWLEAKEMLLSILPYVQHQRTGRVMRRCLEFWLQLAEHVDCEEHSLHVLRALLPYSLEAYSKQLIEKGEYRQWIDLQISADRSPLEIDRAILHEIEARDAEILLPLYHQSIDKHIAEKNRDSYRIAVNLLKSLSACYERLQESDRFQLYIERLADKYRILRAFQEELKRGNLIS